MAAQTDELFISHHHEQSMKSESGLRVVRPKFTQEKIDSTTQKTANYALRRVFTDYDEQYEDETSLLSPDKLREYSRAQLAHAVPRGHRTYAEFIASR